MSKPTHKLGGLFDIVITRRNQPSQDVSVTDGRLFYHMLITWTGYLSAPVPLYITNSRQVWKNFQSDDFKAGLLDSPLREFVFGCETTSDVDKLVYQYNHVIMDLLNKLATVTEFTIHGRVYHLWFDEESRSTRKAVCHLEHWFKLQKTSSSHDAWENALHASRKQLHRKSVAYWKSKIYLPATSHIWYSKLSNCCSDR